MEWMKDDELFADVDGTGSLVEDEMTKLVLAGSAEESVKTTAVYKYCEGITAISEKGNEEQKAFAAELKDVAEYVRKHNHIGKFPSPMTKITIRKTKMVSVQKENPNYNPELAKMERELKEIVEDARYEANMAQFSLHYNADGAQYAYDKIEHAYDKVKRAADDKLEEAGRFAETHGYASSTEAYISDGSCEVEISRKESSILFFDYIAGCWNGSTKLTSALLGIEAKRSVFWETLFRILLWGIFGGCILLMCNMGWKEGNPVSSLLDSLLSPDMAMSVLWVVSLAALLLLCYTSGGAEFTFFGTIPVPWAAFSVPLLFGSFGWAAEGLGKGEAVSSELSENIFVIGTWIAVILFLILLVVKSDFWSNLWDGVKTIGALFLYMGISSVITREIAERPSYMIGCISVFFALCLIGNLIDAFSFFQSHEKQMKTLLKQVNENAFMEYKTLRFVRLWIQNSGLSDKQKYIDAVDRQTNWLKETVKLAEEYARSKKLYFGLKV